MQSDSDSREKLLQVAGDRKLHCNGLRGIYQAPDVFQSAGESA